MYNASYASPISQRQHYHQDVPASRATAAAPDIGIELLINEIRKSRKNAFRNRTHKNYSRRHRYHRRARFTKTN
jgi:hypothetical protein